MLKATGLCFLSGLLNRDRKSDVESYGFFKNSLISFQAQSIVEYTLIFIAFALAIGIFIAKTRQGFETHFQQAVTHILE